ncbi:hypothetical protein GQ54DRAFT_312469 [Martensiomyces pterosporus]|nr:hypothetical protein GQ54DRAFT_312469 [Martensiomyces pterosporus]
MECASGKSLCLCSPHTSPSITNTSNDSHTLLAAMGVCQSWRYAAALFYYREGIFESQDVKPEQKEDKSRDRKSSRSSVLGIRHIAKSGFTQNVRVLHVCAMINDILGGQVSDGLLAVGPLRSVRKIVVRLATGWMRYRRSEDVCSAETDEAELDRLCTVLQRLMPFIRSVEVDFGDVYYDDACSKQCTYLYSRLLEHKHWVLTLVDTPPQIDARCTRLQLVGLAHLSIQVEVWTEHHVELVRQNAATLRSLRLLQIPFHMCSQLLRDSTNSCSIVYPRLHTLEMQLPEFASPSQILVRVDANAFPSLVSIQCRSAYPFASDLLLRCNRQGLERLQMVLPRRFVTDCQQFTPGAYPRLTHVDLSVEGEAEWIKQGATALKLLSKILSLSATAQSIKTSMFVGGSVDFLPEITCHQTLRELVMPRVHFALPTAVRLLQSFPWLTRAAIALGSTSHCRCIPTDEAITEWRSKSASRSAARLLSLELGDARYPTARCSAEYIVLLVSLLPSLKHAAVGSQDTGWLCKIRSAICSTLARKAYSDEQYARLQSVFLL